MLANRQLQHLAQRQAVEVRRSQCGGKVPDLPQAVLEHGADLVEFFGLRMLSSEERTQGIEPQQRQADELGRAIMEIGADPVQKAFTHFDRSATRIDEHRALRFDRLVASPHDAVEQNDLQQRHPANRNPALQAGAIKFGFQARGVGKELRHRNDVIAAFLVDRDVNLKQRPAQATLDPVSLALRALKSVRHSAFQGLEQLGIDRKSLADEIPTGAVNYPPVREANLDGYDLPRQFRILKQIIEGAQRLLAQR